jgi:hypothetical protein
MSGLGGEDAGTRTPACKSISRTARTLETVVTAHVAVARLVEVQQQIRLGVRAVGRAGQLDLGISPPPAAELDAGAHEKLLPARLAADAHDTFLRGKRRREEHYHDGDYSLFSSHGFLH